MKEYFISKITGKNAIDFDSLPVAKITHYPNEKHDYKPYAQVCIGFNETQIGVKVMSFENEPKGYSAIFVILKLFSDKYLKIEVTTNGAVANVVGNSDSKEIKLSKHPIAGEDLQGIYWGSEIFIDFAELAKYGDVIIQKETEITGNFFKVNVLEGQSAHLGAFDKAELNGKVDYIHEEMCKFGIVNY